MRKEWPLPDDRCQMAGGVGVDHASKSATKQTYLPWHANLILLFVMRTIDRHVLGHAWRDCVGRLRAELGRDFAHLKSCRLPERHGSRTSVFVCRLYDDRQSVATLPWRYCSYCLNYDPSEFETTRHNWCVKLHLNTERMYFPDRDVLVEMLKTTLPSVCPDGFDYRPHPRQLVIEHQFSDFRRERLVVDGIHEKLRALVNSTYPVFLRALKLAERSILSNESAPSRPKRPKAHAPAANRSATIDRAALNRSISPRLRASVIAQNADGRCRICGKKCDPADIHIDHILSVANGGLTVASNLQVTCGPCNLSKGSGKQRSSSAHIPAKAKTRVAL